MRTTVSMTTTLILAAAMAACAGGETAGSIAGSESEYQDPLASMEQDLTPLGTPCTFNATTGLMTVTIAAGETAIISRRSSDSTILQNGATCDVAATATTLKRIVVTGSAGVDKLILDFTNGLFALGTSSASTSGIAVDLGAGTDVFAIKGTTGNDNFVYGASGITLNTDANRDITVANAETYIVSLGDGNDTFSAAGSVAAGGVFGTAVTVYGGVGDDTFNQGSAATLSETIYGGPGTDHVSYASRTAALTVTIGAGANDGLAGELDDIQDVEIVTGGSDADTMTASAVAVTFNGGAGNDVLVGGAGNDTLNGGAGNDTLRGMDGNDTLNGEAGDDTFDEGAASNGSDVFNGGAGTDHVDYSARTVALVVTMDGVAANDGESGENDNVKADVENLTGGTQGDSITGNALNNVLTGGLGGDTLNGEAGDDRFPSLAVTDGDDTVNGGAGVDTVDYSLRTAAITALLDGTTGSGLSGEADILGTDCENLWGGTANDVLTGNASANELVGGAGDDTLAGLDGDDTIEGGGAAESNILNGGLGVDVCFGQGSGGGSTTACEL